MRLIDADELMEHAMRDRLDSRELIFDMINNAHTLYEYERGQKDLAEEIYNLIIFDEKSNELRFSRYPDYKESAHAFSDILMKILTLTKEKKDGIN